MEIEKTESQIVDELMKCYPIEDEVSFSEFDIQEKLQKNGFLIMKYKGLYNQNKVNLEKLEEERDRVIGERYNHYRFHYDESLSKVEIEKYYLPRDDAIIALNNKVRLQKVIVDFFDMCVKSLEKVYWNMKTFSENERSGVL